LRQKGKMIMKSSKRLAAFILCFIIAMSGVIPAFAAGGKWVKSGNRWWYRHADSSYTTDDWEKINGKWYHFDKIGWMQSNRWLKDNGKWYHFDKNGWMQSNRWLKDNGKWYYLSASGAMQTGWKRLDRFWYYFNADGSMRTGWLKYRNNWYYLYVDGTMVTDCMEAGGYLDNDGIWREMGPFNFDKAVRKIGMVKGGDYRPEDVRFTTNQAFISAFMDYLKALPVSESEEHKPTMGGGYTLTVYYSDGTVTPAYVNGGNAPYLMCSDVYYDVSYQDIDGFYQKLADLSAGRK